jgi:hypothetical protein
MIVKMEPDRYLRAYGGQQQIPPLWNTSGAESCKDTLQPRNGPHKSRFEHVS